VAPALLSWPLLAAFPLGLGSGRFTLCAFMDLLRLRVLLACPYPHLHSFLTDDGARISREVAPQPHVWQLASFWYSYCGSFTRDLGWIVHFVTTLLRYTIYFIFKLPMVVDFKRLHKTSCLSNCGFCNDLSQSLDLL
jgi:hypothetical protein